MINKETTSFQQYIDKFQIDKCCNDKTEIAYRLFVPNCSNPKLLLFLHGAGERGNDGLTHISYTYDDAFFSLLERNDTIIFAPQCPIDKRWVNRPWGQGSYSIDDISMSDELSLVMEQLNKIIDKYNVDKRNIGITGLSMGGYGTWYLLASFPNLFKYAVPICGGGDPQKAVFMKNTKITVIHGMKDPVVPVQASIDMVKALENANIPVKYNFLPNVEHNSWIWAYHQKDLFL